MDHSNIYGIGENVYINKKFKNLLLLNIAILFVCKKKLIIIIIIITIIIIIIIIIIMIIIIIIMMMIIIMMIIIIIIYLLLLLLLLEFLSSCHFRKEGRKKGSVLFNDTLNTFYLRLYGVRHMVKDHSDSERGNLLLSHGLLFPISSKGSFISTIPQTG